MSNIENWKAMRTPTIMDGLVVRFRLRNPPWQNEPEVSASRNGVMLSGAWPVMDERELAVLGKLLGLALECCRSIQLNGHDAEFGWLPEHLRPVAADFGKAATRTPCQDAGEPA